MDMYIYIDIHMEEYKFGMYEDIFKHSLRETSLSEVMYKHYIYICIYIIYTPVYVCIYIYTLANITVYIYIRIKVVELGLCWLSR